MQNWLKKILVDISGRNDDFSAHSLRFKRKSEVLRILRDYQLIETVSKSGKFQVFRLTLPFKIMTKKFKIYSSIDEFLIDTLFLRMMPWINNGFKSNNFPYKKIVLGIFRIGNLIVAKKRKGRWEVQFTHKGRILVQGYENLAKKNEHPLINAYKNTCWFLFNGNEQINIASHFYRCTLETILTREDPANNIDDYGVLGTRFQNVSELLRQKYQLSTVEIDSFFSIAKDFPGFLELEGDLRTMDREVFLTVFPLNLPSDDPQ